MTDQPTPTWQPPEPVPGPAPGLEFGDFGPRLVAYDSPLRSGDADSHRVG